MALVGKLAGETRWYTPKAEKLHVENIPDYQPTRFLLRMLSAQTMRNLKNLGSGVVTTTGGVRVSAGSIVYEMVREGLAGWENFLGPDGDPLPFRSKGGGKDAPAHDKAMDMLPWDLLEELYEEIERMNEVTEREKKASDSGPGLQPTSESSTAPSAGPGTATTPEPPGGPAPE